MKFVQNVLQEEAAAIEQQQARVINRFGLKDSGNMLTDRTHSVKAEGGSGSVELKFRIYLRFHDMKKKPGANGKRAKAFPLYNKVLFGHLAEIQKRLQFGFTEKVKQQLAGELQIPIQT